MRIMKLLAIVGLSYLGYSVYRHMEQGQPAGRTGGSRRRLREALDEDSGRLQTLTGPSPMQRGTTEAVGDASGVIGRKIVGRGVIQNRAV